jgi:hypothetical protein
LQGQGQCVIFGALYPSKSELIHKHIVKHTITQADGNLCLFVGTGCQLASVKLLVEAGAALDYVNEEGKTALDIVLGFDQEEADCKAIVDLLTSKGAKKKSEL